MPYALFRDGQQISKAHSTREAVAVEAYERGVVVDVGADWPKDRGGTFLCDGFEIKEVT